MNVFKKSLKHIHHLSVHNSHTLISQRDSPRKLLETQVFWEGSAIENRR